MNNKTQLFIKSILAGIAISLGGTVFLRLKDAFTGGNVVGSLLFTIGLFLVCTKGYALFTGKACYLTDNKPSYLLDLLLIWIGNLCGAIIISGIESVTSLCGTSGINTIAAAMVTSKMNSSYISLFFLGFLCNIFIYIAVSGYNKIPHEIGKYLALFLGVSVFILCGTEHSVADMYYWCISGVLFTSPVKSILCLLVITAGNMVGGVLLPILEKFSGIY